MGQLEPAREEILDAFEALHSLTEFAILHSADWKEEGEMRKCCVRIIQALPEKPRPTMAEIEWDDDKHYLAEAEHSTIGTVIMLENMQDSGRIGCLVREEHHASLHCNHPELLTPTGKRYTLTEVQE